MSAVDNSAWLALRDHFENDNVEGFIAGAQTNHWNRATESILPISAIWTHQQLLRPSSFIYVACFYRARKIYWLLKETAGAAGQTLEERFPAQFQSFPLLIYALTGPRPICCEIVADLIAERVSLKGALPPASLSGNCDAFDYVFPALGQSAASTVSTDEVLYRAAEGQSPLTLAIRSGNINMVERILDASQREANLICTLSDSGEYEVQARTPLHYAMKTCDAKIIARFLNASMAECVDGKTGATPLITFVQHAEGPSEDLESLVFESVDWTHCVNNMDRRGKTALHYACEHGRVSIAHRLLEVPGVKFSQFERSQSLSPVHMAVTSCSLAIVESEGYETGLDLDSVAGMSPLHLAAKEDWVDGVAYFLNIDPALARMRDDSGFTPALYAATYGSEDSFGIFLRHDNPDVVGSIRIRSAMTGWTVLHFLACEGHARILRTLFEDNYRMANRLFREVDVRSTEPAMTPLYLAGRAGNIECVQLLIAFGANPNLEQTPKGKKARELARTVELQDLMETLREQVVAMIYHTPDLNEALPLCDDEPDDG